MKIAILSTTTNPTAPGGVERFSQYLRDAFRDHDVAILGIETLSNAQRVVLAAARIVGMRPPLFGYFLGKKALHANFDVYVTNGLFGWNIRHGKIINIQHGTFARAAVRIDRNKNFFVYVMKRYVWGYFEALAARRATRTIAVSRETKESVARYYGRHDAFVIQNAVDTERFAPTDKVEARKKINSTQSELLAVFAGRFEYAKGKDILIAMESYLATHGGRLIVAQDYTQEQLVTLYAAADVFLFPSLHEGCSYALLEAMSVGLPFLANPVGLVADLNVEPLRSSCIASRPTIEEYIRKLESLITMSEPEHMRIQTTIRTYILTHHNLGMFRAAYRDVLNSL